MSESTLMNETRNISALHFERLVSIGISVDEVFEIVPYHEGGEMGHIVWFHARDRYGNTLYRVPARGVSIVEYEVPDE
jgi:hypothetical protein